MSTDFGQQKNKQTQNDRDILRQRRQEICRRVFSGEALVAYHTFFRYNIAEILVSDQSIKTEKVNHEWKGGEIKSNDGKDFLQAARRF